MGESSDDEDDSDDDEDEDEVTKPLISKSTHKTCLHLCAVILYQKSTRLSGTKR